MTYISSLKEDIANGFTKTQLEILIDLPKNSLASLISGKRKISAKTQAKLKKWNASQKPDPLTLVKLERPTKIEDENLPISGVKLPVTIFPTDGTQPKDFNQILTMAKNGASESEVEKAIKQNGKLTPGQIGMIKSKIISE